MSHAEYICSGVKVVKISTKVRLTEKQVVVFLNAPQSNKLLARNDDHVDCGAEDELVQLVLRIDNGC